MRADKKILEREVIGGVTVLRVLVPELGPDAALWMLEDEFSHILEAPAEGPTRVVLNLGPLQHIHTTVLAKLVSFRTKVLAAGGEVCLCCVSPGVREILQVTHFDRLFSIYPAEPEALAAMR